MGQVLVRNLDDHVIASLKLRAETKGHSLEQELRDIITAAAPFSPAERAAISQWFLSQSPPARELSEDLIREDRDSR